VDPSGPVKDALDRVKDVEETVGRTVEPVNEQTEALLDYLLGP